jgi:trimeric autotransporter adhesin
LNKSLLFEDKTKKKASTSEDSSESNDNTVANDDRVNNDNTMTNEADRYSSDSGNEPDRDSDSENEPDYDSSSDSGNGKPKSGNNETKSSNDSNSDSDSNSEDKSREVRENSIYLNSDSSPVNNDKEREASLPDSDREYPYRNFQQTMHALEEKEQDRKVLNKALEQQNEGVPPSQNIALQILQSQYPKALQNSENSVDFMVKIDKIITTKTEKLAEVAAIKLEEGNTLGIPSASRKRSSDEDIENSNAKRSKSESSVETTDSTVNSVKEDKIFSAENNKTTTSSSSLSQNTGLSSNTDTNPSKSDNQSPIDYVLEKQACEMPDIPDSDGGGD